MPQYNSTDKRTQTIGIENYTESDIVLEVIGDTTFTGDVSLGDDHVINLGDANDLKIYHDSTFNNGVIQESGSGNLLLAGQNIDFRDANLGDSYAIFRDDSVNTSVELYYNNTKKFETTTTGVTVIGTVVADGVDLGDDERIRLGDAQDLQIYHNGTTAQSIIEESGGGSLLIQGTNLLLRSTAGENYFQGTANGSVELFYDAAKKFETTATGATTTGIHVADGFDAGDNERIRLGDAQDLQIYHDTANSIIDTATGNLILSSANAIDIYNSAITEVRARFLNDGGVELYYDNAKKFETTTTGATVTGVLVADGVDLGDDDRLRFGDAQDLQIWHNSSNNNSVIQENGAGDLNILANDLNIRNQTGNETIAQFKQDAEVSLNYDNVRRFETTATGAKVTGTLDVDGLTLGDDEKIQLGNDPDFEIYHTAANGSYIADIGNGPLKVSSDNVQIKNAADSELLATFTESGSVELYDQNAKKFETTGTGADVTGTLRASTSLVTTTDGTGITITNNAIQGPATITIDPAAVGDNTGTVVIAGDLQVDGTTTTINSTTVTIDDLNLTLASDVTTQAATNGAGITLGPSGANATWTYLSASDTLNHNKRTRISGSSGITDLAQTLIVQDTTASAADVGGTIGFTGNESAGEATLSLIKGGYVSDGNGYLEFYTNQTDTLTTTGRFTETGSFIVSNALTTTTYTAHIDDNKSTGAGLLVTGGGDTGLLAKFQRDIVGAGDVDVLCADSNPSIRFTEVGGLGEQFTVGVNQNINIGTAEVPEIISRFEVCDFSKLGTNQRIVITSAGDVGVAIPEPEAKLDVNGSCKLRFTVEDADNSTGNVNQVFKSQGTTAWLWRNSDGRDWETNYDYQTGDVVNGQVEIDTFTNIRFLAASIANQDTQAGGNNVEVEVSIASGLQEGNFVFVMGANDSINFNTNNFTAGWTVGPVAGLDNNSAPDTFWAYRYLGAGETSATFSSGQTKDDEPALLMVAFSGVDPTEPFGPGTTDPVSPTTPIIVANAATTGSPNPPQVTTTVNECMILAIGFLDDDQSANTVSPPVGFALAAAGDAGSNTQGDGAVVMAAYAKLTESGAIDPGSFTTTSDENKAITIALHPTQGTTLIRRLFRASGTFTSLGTTFPGVQQIGSDWEEISPGGDGSIVVPGADGGATGDTEDKFKTIVSDSGQTTADTVSDVLSIVGGTGITTSIVGDTLTITNTGGGGTGGSQNIWSTIQADSGTTTANIVGDTLTIAGGTDIGTSITGDTVTINYTGAAGGINTYAKFFGDGTPDINANATYGKITWIDTSPTFSATAGSAWATNVVNPQPGDTANGIIVPTGGIYLVTLNWYFTSTVIRANPGIRLAVNNVLQAETSASGYIRNNGGHNESSGTISTTLDLTAGDEISVYAQQLAQAGTVSLQGNQSSITLTKLA